MPNLSPLISFFIFGKLDFDGFRRLSAGVSAVAGDANPVIESSSMRAFDAVCIP